MKSAKVVNIEVIDSDDLVYDIEVQDNHNFFTNGDVLSSNCYVILDEAQNTTVEQMKLFITRIGEHSQFAINGDATQSDLKSWDGENGLAWITRCLRGVSPDIQVVEFSVSDVVRSEIVKTILTHISNPVNKPTEPVRRERVERPERGQHVGALLS